MVPRGERPGQARRAIGLSDKIVGPGPAPDAIVSRSPSADGREGRRGTSRASGVRRPVTGMARPGGRTTNLSPNIPDDPLSRGRAKRAPLLPLSRPCHGTLGRYADCSYAGNHVREPRMDGAGAGRTGRRAAGFRRRVAPLLPEGRDRPAPGAAGPRPGRPRDRGRAQRPRRPRGHARLPRGGRERRRLRPARELLQCAVVALGGYGRRELSPVLRRGPALPPPAAPPRRRSPSFVERTLITLWDAGLSVGHSFRSARDCVSAAREDLHSRTALAEARLVTGNQALFDALHLRLETSLRGSRAAPAGVRGPDARASGRSGSPKHGGAVCVLEPQVKEGPGGLRDLHAVLWVAQRAVRRARASPASTRRACSTPADYAAARQAYDFLLRVRNEAHFTTGRKTDLLTLDLQRRAGPAPRLPATAGSLLASELLMRDYYRRAFRLHEICSAFVETHVEPKPRRRFFGSLRLRRPGRRGARGEGRRAPAAQRAGRRAAAAASWTPSSAAQSSGRAGVARAEAHPARARDAPGGRFRKSKEAGAHADEARGAAAAAWPRACALMHETGVLGRLVPEWSRDHLPGAARLLPPVHGGRAHAARGGRARRAGAGPGPAGLAPLARLLDEVEDARPLYLGMLLHDIGKGRGGGHVPKGVVLARAHPEPAAGSRPRWRTTRSSWSAPTSRCRRPRSSATSPSPALIETLRRPRRAACDRLNLLMLLTYADHRGGGARHLERVEGVAAVGPLRAHAAPARGLARGGGRPRSAQRARPRRRRPAALLPARRRSSATSRSLPERYLRATDAAAPGEPLPPGARRAATRAAAFEWADRGDGRGTELTVTAARPSGPAVAAWPGRSPCTGLDILGADLFTRNDGLVLDTLRVAELPGPAAAAARAARAPGGGAARRGRRARSTWRTPLERWRRAEPRRTRRPGGRAARQPSVRFDQEASARRDRGRGEGARPARPRLHARPHAGDEPDSTSPRRASPRPRRWRSTCSTYATRRVGSSTPRPWPAWRARCSAALGARADTSSEG